MFKDQCVKAVAGYEVHLTGPLGLGAEIKPVGFHSAMNFEYTTCATFGEGKLKTHTWHSTK